MNASPTPPWARTGLSWLAAGLFFIFGSAIVLKGQDLVLSVNFVDEVGGNEETWTQTRQDVVFQAITDWVGFLSVDETVFFDVTFEAAGTDGYLGQWQGGGAFFEGADVRPWTDGVAHTIKFNSSLMDANEPNYLWFGDLNDPLPFEAWDALSVARHEVGHMLGFTSGLYFDQIFTENQSHPWTSQIDENDRFDPVSLDVPMDPDHSHLAQELNDLMSPVLVNGQRRDVTLLHAEMLATAYPEYTVIPEPAAAAAILAFASLLWARRRRAS